MASYIALAAFCAVYAAQGSLADENGHSGNGTLSTGSTPAAASSSTTSSQAAKAMLEQLNNYLDRDYLIALAAVALALFVYRAAISVVQHTRTVACLSNDTQRYFAIPNLDFTKFKNQFLYAPVFKNRHNREFHLSSALNMGTLPTRFQSIFLIGIVAANITLCVYDIPWMSAEASILPVLRNRMGTIAVANMIPVMVLSSPKNPLIKLLNVSYDSMNIMHRNFARLAVVEAIVHMLCWVIGEVQKSGWSAVWSTLMKSGLEGTGAVAVIAFIVISIQASSAIRHAFYEAFLHLHIALVVVTLVFLWMHLDGFPQQNYLLGAMVTWAVMRFLRLYTFVRCNLGRERTKASIEVLPGNALRISVSASRNVQAHPGSYMYLYIPSVGISTSHPFSVAWTDVEVPLSRISSDPMYKETGGSSMIKEAGGSVYSIPQSELGGKQALSAVVRRRTGFTDSLYRKADKAGAYDGVKLTLNAYVETGYGVHQSVLSSCGTVMLFAGGVGITHQMPYVRHLVEGYAAGTVAARKVVLVWVTQSPEHLEWIRPWMTQILSMDRRREVLMIKLYITRPTSPKEVTSPSATVQMFPGRPDIPALIKNEAASQLGCMGVSVCGPGTFSDNVRAGVRQQKASNIEFVEESFSW